jgi:hypothetical protein
MLQPTLPCTIQCITLTYNPPLFIQQVGDQQDEFKISSVVFTTVFIQNQTGSALTTEPVRLITDYNRLPPPAMDCHSDGQKSEQPKVCNSIYWMFVADHPINST